MRTKRQVARLLTAASIAGAMLLSACAASDDDGSPADPGEEGTADDVGADGSDGAGTPDEWQELYEAAQEEGQLVISSNALAIEQTASDFEERFPGIQVEVLVQTAGQTAETVITELGAGQTPSVDVGYMTPSIAEPLLDEDAMMDVDWVALGVPEEQLMTSLQQRAVHWIDFIYIISYNTDLVDEDEVPTDWVELRDTDLPVAVDPRGHGYGEYALFAGDDDARQLAEDMDDDVELVFAPTAGGRMATAVAAGQAAFGFMDHLSQIQRLQAVGAPIDWVRTDDITAGPFGLYVVEEAQNVNAAQLFIAWAVSEEGISVHERNANQPPITGFEYDSDVGQMVDQEWGATVHTQLDLTLEEILENGRFRTEIATIFD